MDPDLQSNDNLEAMRKHFDEVFDRVENRSGPEHRSVSRNQVLSRLKRSMFRLVLISERPLNASGKHFLTSPQRGAAHEAPPPCGL